MRSSPPSTRTIAPRTGGCRPETVETYPTPPPAGPCAVAAGMSASPVATKTTRRLVSWARGGRTPGVCPNQQRPVCKRLLLRDQHEAGGVWLAPHRPLPQRYSALDALVAVEEAAGEARERGERADRHD